MYTNKSSDYYRKSEVMTADPKQLVALCYRAVIMNFKLAKTKYMEKEYEAKAKALEKAINIVSELRSSLDFDKGGQIAANLNALYGYAMDRALEADIQQDIGVFDEIIHIFEELSEAWTIGVLKGEKIQDHNAPDIRMPQPGLSSGSDNRTALRI